MKKQLFVIATMMAMSAFAQDTVKVFVVTANGPATGNTAPFDSASLKRRDSLNAYVTPSKLKIETAAIYTKVKTDSAALAAAIDAIEVGGIASENYTIPSKNIYRGHASDALYSYMGESGPISYGFGADMSEKIPVIANQQLIASGYPGSMPTDIYIGFYDNSDVLTAVKLLFKNGESTGRVVEVPANAATAQFTTKLPGNTWNELQLEYGSVATAYAPYATSVLPILTTYGTKRLANAISYGEITQPKSIVTKEYFEKYYYPKATEGKTLLTFGDSITDSTWNYGSNWPAFAKTELRCNVRNFAYVGASYYEYASPANPRLFINNQITDAINAGVQPDIITINLSRNDIIAGKHATVDGDAYTVAINKTIAALDRTNELEAMRSALYRITNQWPFAKVFVVNAIQAAGDEPIYYEQYFSLMERMANRYGATFCNAYGEAGILAEFENVGSGGRFLYDGTHPGLEGKKMLGRYMAAKILSNYKPIQ